MVRFRQGVVGFLVAAGIGGVSAAFGEVTTVSYREAPESFTWELRWDGQLPKGPLELVPPRPEGERTESWAPFLKLSRPLSGGTGARFSVRARHAVRVHDLDAPQGPRYDAVFLLRPGSGPTSDWVRLDRRQLPHLSTPKDTLDTLDVCWKVDVLPEGERIGRLIIQGAHGPAGRAKKAKKGKSKAPKLKNANLRPMGGE